MTPLLVQPKPPTGLNLRAGKHAVLLFHGLSSSPLELSFIARGLHRLGYTVSVPVIASYTHGLGPSMPMQVDAWVSAGLRALDELAQDCETISIGGLCLGAVLALRVATLRNDKIAHVLALSTALHFDGWANPWYTPFLPLSRFVKPVQKIIIAEKEPFGLKDERMRTWIQRQMITAGGSDAGAAGLSIHGLLKSRELIGLTRNALSLITAPVLLVHAKQDECATPKSAYEVAAKVSSSDIRLVLLNNSYHMITIDQEKVAVLSEIVQFLDPARAKKSPGQINNLVPVDFGKTKIIN
jgi:carboxylesterase